VRNRFQAFAFKCNLYRYAGGCSHYHVCHNVSEVIPPAVSWVSADRYWSSPPHKPGGGCTSQIQLDP
jgi:hypothetical protein